MVFQTYAEKEFAAQSAALEEFSILFLTYTIANNPKEGKASWPYVTVPFEQYEKIAQRVTSIPNEGIVWIAPIVTDVISWNTYCAEIWSTSNISMSPNMFAYDSDGVARKVNGTGSFTPIHQIYPNPNIITNINSSIVNFDISSDSQVNSSSALAYDREQIVLSGLLQSMIIRDSYPDIFDATEPISMLVAPIHSTYEEQSNIIGYAQNVFTWKSFFSKFDGVVHPIVCKVENTCGEVFTFLVDDHNATFIHSENSINTWIHDLSIRLSFGLTYNNITAEEAQEAGICLYSLTVYPTTEFRQEYDLNATLYAVAVGITMLFMLSTFFAYD